MSFRYLFIGGYADGAWREVPREIHRVRIPVVPGFHLKPFGSPDFLGTITEYAEERFLVGKQEYRIFIPIGTSVVTAFEQLLKGYCAQRKGCI